MEEIPDEERQSGERDRDTWAKVGVLVNELARPALFLNLPTSETESYGRPPGEPAYASLRALLRSSPAWNVAGREVYVCENANLLSIAADRWGPNCAPVVCTDGMPAAAQRCLLSQLASAGARLLYHGDFDWPGIRIGNHVMREHGAQPWRFCADDYEAALRAAPTIAEPLAGKAVDAVWDPALPTVMQHQFLSPKKAWRPHCSRIWATANLLAPVTAPEDSAALECASSFIDATKSIKQPPC